MSNEVQEKLKTLRGKLNEKDQSSETEALLYLATGRVPPKSLQEEFDKSYYPVKNIALSLAEGADLESFSKFMAECVKTIHPEIIEAAMMFNMDVNYALKKGDVSEEKLREIGKNVVKDMGLDKHYDFSKPLTKEQKEHLQNYASTRVTYREGYTAIEAKRNNVNG